MKIFQRYWSAANWVVVFNASSLVATTIVNLALGFSYWWLAARQFPPEAVGFASATFSAMMMLGTIGLLGLGTLLIGELPRQRGNQLSLITTALVVAGMAGAGLGTLFTIVAPYISVDLQPLRASLGSIALFASGVALVAVTGVLDQALIGLLRGGLQLWRNMLFSVVKLVALLLAGVWWADGLGLTIYATWVVGSFISLAALGSLVVRGIPIRAYRPRWRMLQGLGWAALKHHTLNVTLQLTGYVMPLLVTALLGTTMNAYFYTAGMVSGLVYVGPGALTTVLYAVGAAEPAALAHRIRLTLGLALVAGLLGNGFLLLGGGPILSLFGPAYVQQAEQALHIFALGVFPIIIREHYVAIHRIYGLTISALPFVLVGSFLNIVLGAIGASLGSLVGLALGLLVAMCVEALLMAPTVYKVAAGASMAGCHPPSDGWPSHSLHHHQP
jgi:O-antigen/teichoic acid export membrane protein